MTKDRIDLINRAKNVWSGEYKGIHFEIQNWETGFMRRYDMNNWTHYIFLSLENIPKEYKPKSFWLEPKGRGERKSCQYYNHKIIANIKFAGGCTYYSKKIDDEIKYIKIGCDYQHLWDTERRAPYDLDHILFEVKITIDSLFKLMPNLKIWCNGNGNFYPISEGKFKKNRFYSDEYLTKCLTEQKEKEEQNNE